MTLDDIKKLEDQLWEAADNLRANTDLKPNEYATPVLGLIFLKFADNKYSFYEPAIIAEFEELKDTRRSKTIEELAIQYCGFYLPDKARYKYLLELPESEDIATKIKEAMQAIEDHKNDDEFVDVLPKDEYSAFNRLQQSKSALHDLLKNFSNIPTDASGDVFGRIYEYFLGKFALSEGQKGGEFFTPTSVVQLMVEMIEPYHGTVYDPACGSGGMFVQSLHFVERHNQLLKDMGKLDSEESVNLSVYGQEKTRDTVKLAKMNLFVNGLKGEIRQANSYSEDPFNGYEKFDFIMANPPFNVDDVTVATVETDKRFTTYGLPRKKTKSTKSENNAKAETVTNGNYLWINLFVTSLRNQAQAKANNSGRAALVMPNSASDARNAEADIRQKLIEHNLISTMLTLPSNMFYTVTLPATLWFFDKNKVDDNILFIDARNIFRQIDRAHRDFTDEQIQNIAMINKLHHGRRQEYISLIHSYFAKGMELLQATISDVAPVVAQLKLVAAEEPVLLTIISQLDKHWQELGPLESSYQNYLSNHDISKDNDDSINKINVAQIILSQEFEPFFKALHEDTKILDKAIRQKEKHHKEQVKQARQTLDEAKKGGDKELTKQYDKTYKALTATTAKIKDIKALLTTIKVDRQQAEYYFSHINWLQQRFPQASYEDVIGLCKLASPIEVQEQDYSLNAGRYVGVVMEEDGKTEDEFLEDLQAMNEQLLHLSKQADELGETIQKNLSAILGES